MDWREEIQKRLGAIEAQLRDVEFEKGRFRPSLATIHAVREGANALGIAMQAATEALYREQERLADEKARLQRELENLGKPKPPEAFEIIDAEEAQEEDGRLYLVLTERDSDGEVEGRTHLASFSDMKFMDSLGPRLAKLCLETAQAELAGRAA